jgi:hypothetical protein
MYAKCRYGQRNPSSLCKVQSGMGRMFDWVDYWAKEKTDALALIEYNTEAEITWKDFATKIKAFAAKLLCTKIMSKKIIFL